jgi:hypothetical protein
MAHGDTELPWEARQPVILSPSLVILIPQAPEKDLSSPLSVGFAKNPSSGSHPDLIGAGSWRWEKPTVNHRTIHDGCPLTSATAVLAKYESGLRFWTGDYCGLQGRSSLERVPRIEEVDCACASREAWPVRPPKPISIIFGLLIAGPLVAQTPDHVLRRGTPLQVKLDTGLNTRNARVGDGVEAHLAKPVLLNGEVILPKGTYVRGRVHAARSADRKQKVAPALRLTFDEIALPSHRTLKAQASVHYLPGFDVNADGELTTPEISRRSVVSSLVFGAVFDAGIGALIARGKGAIIGGVLGALIAVPALAIPHSRWRDLYLYKGMKLTLRLDQDLPAP